MHDYRHLMEPPFGMKKSHIVLGITGASGVVYGLNLCRALLEAHYSVTVLISRTGFDVLRHEAGLHWRDEEKGVEACLKEAFSFAGERIHFHAEDNFMAPIASGSSAPDAMVICPCSMGCLSRIACGNSGTLLERCADVMLKECRPLVLVPRETPLNEIHLENMLRLSRAGARIVPAMPAFYHNPQTVDEIVNFVVGKVMDALGIGSDLFRRWGEEQGAGSGERRAMRLEAGVSSQEPGAGVSGKEQGAGGEW